jgi:hypothetical protein
MQRSVRFGELLIVIVIVLAAFITGSFTASFVAATQVENHIDATIANTVKQAEQNAVTQSNSAQAKDIKDLHGALSQAVTAITAECATITHLGGQCPTVTITLPPGE